MRIPMIARQLEKDERGRADRPASRGTLIPLMASMRLDFSSALVACHDEE